MNGLNSIFNRWSRNIHNLFEKKYRIDTISFFNLYTMNTPSTFSATQESVDVLHLIQHLRNDLIKDFLDERNLISYVATNYKINDLSAVKVEFIKADLKRLLASPIDETWYAPIIEEFKTTGTVALAEGNEKLFYKEIENVLKKNMY